MPYTFVYICGVVYMRKKLTYAQSPIWFRIFPRHTYLCQNDRCVVGKETAIWAHLYVVNTVLYTSERIIVLDSASVGFSNNYLLTKDQMCSAYREFSRPLLADTRSGARKTVNFPIGQISRSAKFPQGPSQIFQSARSDIRSAKSSGRPNLTYGVNQIVSTWGDKKVGRISP